MRRKGGGSGDNSGWKLRSLLHDNRAQSVVIGSILIFAIVVTLLGVFQATVIPSANEDVEVEHSQQVRGEMQDIRNNVLQSAATGQDTRQTVKIGVEYPQRLLFINPGPTSGSIRTEGTSEPEVAIALENVEATDPETRQYLGGGTTGFKTGAIVYRQDYNIYQSAPDSVTVEHSLAYSTFSDGTEFVTTGQQIVSGKEISLVAIDGDLSRSEVGQYTVDTEAVSASTTTVPVRDDGDAIRITISTRLSQETLIQDVFRSQIDDEGGPPAAGDTTCGDISTDPSDLDDADRYIDNCEFNPDGGPSGEFNNFTLVMEQGSTYTLELAKVGVGTDISQPDPTYLVDTEGRESDIPLTGRQRLGFEVRDEYNNGIGGQKLDVRIESPSDFGNLVYKGTDVGENTTVEVEPDGSVDGLYYQAPGSSDSSPQDVVIEAKFDSGSVDYPSDGSNTQKNVQFTLQVVNGSRVDRTTPLFNPGSGVTISGVTIIGDDPGESECGSGSDKAICEIEVTFESDSDITADEIRYSFYSDDTSSSAGIDTYPNLEIMELPSGPSKTYEIQSTAESTPGPGITFDSSGTTTVSFKFLDSAETAPSDRIQPGDWFVIELTFDNGQSQTYFIVITS